MAAAAGGGGICNMPPRCGHANSASELLLSEVVNCGVGVRGTTLSCLGRGCDGTSAGS